jgi:hypothetical protein
MTYHMTPFFISFSYIFSNMFQVLKLRISIITVMIVIQNNPLSGNQVALI